jgi:Cu(I)/Ag(I) efflux system membrane protein CusA/SilA
MTVLANVFGLLPILFDDGVGADLAKRIALPMWGGLVSLMLLTLFVVPAVYVVCAVFICVAPGNSATSQEVRNDRRRRRM